MNMGTANGGFLDHRPHWTTDLGRSWARCVFMWLVVGREEKGAQQMFVE